MIDEPLDIENIQLKIEEYQKKIRYNFIMIHNEELEEHQVSQVINETNKLKESVYTLQNKLKELYRQMYSGSKKEFARNI